MYILDTSNYRVLKWSLGDPFGTVVVNGRGSGTTLDKIGVSYSIFVDSQSNNHAIPNMEIIVLLSG